MPNTTDFLSVLKRVIARQDAKTQIIEKRPAMEVTLEEQMRIMARIKAQYNTSYTYNNPRRSHRDLNEMYKG